MKTKIIKMLIQIFLLFIFITQQIYCKDSLLIDMSDYRLFFIGESQSIAELKSKFIAGYTFVNIPKDISFFNPEYPNPFSPSMVKQNFIYELSDYANVIISIVDNKDSILFNVTMGTMPNGFYRFMFKDEYFMKPTLSRRVLSSSNNIRIVFFIGESKFIFPLRNTNIDKSN